MEISCEKAALLLSPVFSLLSARLLVSPAARSGAGTTTSLWTPTTTSPSPRLVPGAGAGGGRGLRVGTSCSGGPSLSRTGRGGAGGGVEDLRSFFALLRSEVLVDLGRWSRVFCLAWKKGSVVK